MKTSSPSSPKLPSRKSVLLIGPPGGGKTTLAMQFPRVRFYDCDENLDGPELHLRRKFPYLEYQYESIKKDDNGKVVPLPLCADRLCDLLEKGIADEWPKTLVIDGLTYINEFLISKTMAKQGRGVDGTMERQDWIPFRRYLLRILIELRNANKHTILTCHEEILQREVKGQGLIVTGYRPAVSSKITDQFSGFFTDVWRCTPSLPLAGKPRPFKVQVMSDGMSALKNSVGFPSEVMDADWSELNKYLKMEEA